MSRRSPDPSRVAALLVAVGCVSVLGLTFLGGVAAGRHWPRWLPSLGSPIARADGEGPADKADEVRPGDKMRRALPTPLLTFYHELTAPLTAPPPPKPKAADKPPAKAGALAADAGDGADSRVDMTAPLGFPGARYAVQVGAFKQWRPAEAMRANLASAGWDAYLTEIEGTDLVRYRVRVGRYTTRDEARQAAQRLSSERRLSTYVTAR